MAGSRALSERLTEEITKYINGFDYIKDGKLKHKKGATAQGLGRAKAFQNLIKGNSLSNENLAIQLLFTPFTYNYTTKYLHRNVTEENETYLGKRKMTGGSKLLFKMIIKAMYEIFFPHEKSDHTATGILEDKVLKHLCNHLNISEDHIKILDAKLCSKVPTHSNGVAPPPGSFRKQAMQQLIDQHKKLSSAVELRIRSQAV